MLEKKQSLLLTRIPKAVIVLSKTMKSLGFFSPYQKIIGVPVANPQL